MKKKRKKPAASGIRVGSFQLSRPRTSHKWYWSWFFSIAQANSPKVIRFQTEWKQPYALYLVFLCLFHKLLAFWPSITGELLPSTWLHYWTLWWINSIGLKPQALEDRLIEKKVEKISCKWYWGWFFSIALANSPKIIRF